MKKTGIEQIKSQLRLELRRVQSLKRQRKKNDMEHSIPLTLECDLKLGEQALQQGNITLMKHTLSSLKQYH